MNSFVQIVLVETSHPGNIGSVARAMKNMGLSNLALINPKKFPHQEAIALAGDILKIDPDNQIIQQYLKVLDEHKTLAEEREAERDEEDDEDDDEDDDDEEEEDDNDNNNLSTADGKKKSHK